MATSYPTSLDSFTNPTAVDTLDSPPHDTQHADGNDAIEALQAKVGVDSSAVATSLDYRVGQLELGGGSMEVSSTAPSSPSEGDMWYDDTTGRTYVYYDDGSSQQWVEFGAPPSGIGKILQVVQATYGTAEATTSSTYVDTSLNASITPSATSSKVLIISNFSWDSSRTGRSSSGEIYHAIERGGSQIWEQPSGYYKDGANNEDRTMRGNTTLTYLDSPVTTSATTYTLQHRSTGGTGTPTATTFYGNIPASLILVEVSA